jgi:hypothetical protein
MSELAMIELGKVAGKGTALRCYEKTQLRAPNGKGTASAVPLGGLLSAALAAEEKHRATWKSGPSGPRKPSEIGTGFSPRGRFSFGNYVSQHFVQPPRSANSPARAA